MNIRRQTKSGLMVGSLSLFFLLGSSSSVESTTTKTEGAIQFEWSSAPTVPLDPTEPTNPIVPTKPSTEGPLSIDYVTDFSFGTHKRNQHANEEYFATLPSIELVETREKKQVPHFVQVTDNRNSGSGWKLYVQQTKPLTNEKGFSLKGATLNFYHTTYISLDGIGKKPTGIPQNPIVLSGHSKENVLVGSAEDKTGMGSWGIQFGTTSESGKKGVSLKVPKETEKKDGSYSTSLTWSLVDGL